VENPTPGLTVTGARDADKSPDQIERDMAQTRDSITEKVALLENQVLGNIQSVTSGVTEAVDAVKEAVTTAPAAVSDTVKQTVEAMKESVRSIDVTGCIRDNPAAALGASTLGGFVIGLMFGGGRSRRAAAPTMPFTGQPVQSAAPSGGFQLPGFVEDMLGMVTRELKQVAETALSSAVASLKQNISTAVPTIVETAVHRVTDAVNHVNGSDHGTNRVHGPDYAARG